MDRSGIYRGRLLFKFGVEVMNRFSVMSRYPDAIGDKSLKNSIFLRFLKVKNVLNRAYGLDPWLDKVKGVVLRLWGEFCKISAGLRGLIIQKRAQKRARIDQNVPKMNEKWGSLILKYLNNHPSYGNFDLIFGKLIKIAIYNISTPWP